VNPRPPHAPEQPTSLVDVDHCDGRLRPLHVLDRQAGHLLLADEPAEELLDRAETVAGLRAASSARNSSMCARRGSAAALLRA
jgi:hypothetical protein